MNFPACVFNYFFINRLYPSFVGNPYGRQVDGQKSTEIIVAIKGHMLLYDLARSFHSDGLLRRTFPQRKRRSPAVFSSAFLLYQPSLIAIVGWSSDEISTRKKTENRWCCCHFFGLNFKCCSIFRCRRHATTYSVQTLSATSTTNSFPC